MKKYENYAWDAETALITLPFLFGWIYGILRYRINTREFVISLHTGLLSSGFLFIYGLLNAGNVFWEMPGDNPLAILQSIMSFSYLAISVYNFIMARKGHQLPGEKFPQSLLDRLFRIQD